MIQRKQAKVVDSFTGPFSFLGLEQSCQVYHAGHVYNSAAHAYAAARLLFAQDKASSKSLGDFSFESLLRRI